MLAAHAPPLRGFRQGIVVLADGADLVGRDFCVFYQYGIGVEVSLRGSDGNIFVKSRGRSHDLKEGLHESVGAEQI